MGTWRTETSWGYPIGRPDHYRGVIIKGYPIGRPTMIGVSSLRDIRSVEPTIIGVPSSVPIEHLTTTDSKQSAQADGLLALQALVEALGGRRDRSSSFNARLLGSLPHLKETSVENYISQVELL